MLPFWKLVFLISPVITLVLPSGHFIGPFLMAWAGLFYRRQAVDQSPIAVGPIKTSWVWMLGGVWCFDSDRCEFGHCSFKPCGAL